MNLFLVIHKFRTFLGTPNYSPFSRQTPATCFGSMPITHFPCSVRCLPCPNTRPGSFSDSRPAWESSANLSSNIRPPLCSLFCEHNPNMLGEFAPKYCQFSKLIYITNWSLIRCWTSWMLLWLLVSRERVLVVNHSYNCIVFIQGTINSVLLSEDSNFPDEVFRLVKLETQGQKKLYKLVSSINVLCNLIQVGW